MTSSRVLGTLTTMTPVPCTECGKTMPIGTVAWIPAWGQIAHWCGGCADDDEDDDDWDDDEDEDDR